MRVVRDIIRKIRYNLKFLNRSKYTELSYTVNSSSNSKLTELMNFYGSDKGNKTNHHNYSEFYSELFFNNRKEIKNFLEIGLGTNNTDIPSNMGSAGTPLASLKAWRDYFENANIYGADIDKNILKDENRIKTFYVDQLNPESIKNLFDKIGNKKFDIILEDGLHEFNANICFFENSIKYLSSKGTYIIEDVYYKDQEKFINYFKDLNYNFAIIDIYHDFNISNNCLIVIKKNND